MRDLETNVYNFYKELAKIHAKSFPDMRPGQFLLNALGGIYADQKIDPFFPEAPELIDRIRQYANNASPFYRGWEVLRKKEEDMVEILGHNLSGYFKDDDRGDAKLTYRGKEYEVWEVSESHFGYMEDQSKEEFKAQAGEDAWWEYSDMGRYSMPNATIVINGCYLNAYNLGDPEWRTDYKSLTDYIYSHVGSTRPASVCWIATSLAEDNDMTMGELFNKCEK